MSLFLIITAVRDMDDVTESIGGSATFKVQLPRKDAVVEWTHNGKRIYPEKYPNKYEIITDGLIKKLIIKNLRIDEEGTLGAKIGEETCTAKLHIQGLYSQHMLRVLRQKSNAFTC